MVTFGLITMSVDIGSNWIQYAQSDFLNISNGKFLIKSDGCVDIESGYLSYLAIGK